MKKVMCFGTFDLLHIGHLSYLKQAKKYGDYLVVVIARDTTKEKQNKKIIFNEKERLELINSLKMVDETVLGDRKDFLRIIRKHNPNVICLGYDHKVDEDNLSNKLLDSGLNLTIKRLKPYKIKKHKSSFIREKVLKVK